MKNAFKRALAILSVVGLLFGSGLAVGTPTVHAKTVTPVVSAPAVKKSVNSICHAKGTRYYAQTKKFTAYKTLKDCIKSGGRMPR